MFAGTVLRGLSVCHRGRVRWHFVPLSRGTLSAQYWRAQSCPVLNSYTWDLVIGKGGQTRGPAPRYHGWRPGVIRCHLYADWSSGCGGCSRSLCLGVWVPLSISAPPMSHSKNLPCPPLVRSPSPGVSTCNGALQTSRCSAGPAPWSRSAPTRGSVIPVHNPS